MKVDFCLPIYNEEKILAANVAKLLNFCETQNFEFDWQIVIINNNSSDNSLKIAAELASKKIKIVNISTPGKGAAVKGYGSMCESDIMVYMDIDLAVDLSSLPDLIQPILRSESELVAGSRLLPQSKTERSVLRTLSSKSYILLTRLILNHNLTDLQCGFKALKTDAFKKIIPLIKNDRWFFDTEMVTMFLLYNYRTTEIPVNWKECRYEQRKSKMKFFRDSVKFFINLIKFKFRLIKLNKHLAKKALNSESEITS